MNERELIDHLFIRPLTLLEDWSRSCCCTFRWPTNPKGKKKKKGKKKNASKISKITAEKKKPVEEPREFIFGKNALIIRSESIIINQNRVLLSFHGGGQDQSKYHAFSRPAPHGDFFFFFFSSVSLLLLYYLFGFLASYRNNPSTCKPKINRNINRSLRALRISGFDGGWYSRGFFFVFPLLVYWKLKTIDFSMISVISCSVVVREALGKRYRLGGFFLWLKLCFATSNSPIVILV